MTRSHDAPSMRSVLIEEFLFAGDDKRAQMMEGDPSLKGMFDRLVEYEARLHKKAEARLRKLGDEQAFGFRAAGAVYEARLHGKAGVE